MRALPFVIVAAMAASAHADGKFHKVPGKDKLQLRVVKYDGEVNGQLTVELRNKSEDDLRFTARGLYFVPDGDPDQAPQRLGAVGPIHVGEKDRESVTVPAGGKVEITLDVFCVDDEREAPTSETPFTVARHRMPNTLAKRIDASAGKAARTHAPMDDVQTAVWEARDDKYKALDGEGAQEEGRTSSHHNHTHEDERMKEPMKELTPEEDDR